MKSLRKYVLPVLASVLAVGLTSQAAMASNPIVKNGWKMPKVAAGNTTACNNVLKEASTNLAFGDCFNQNTLMVRMTGEPNGNHPPKSMMAFLESIVQTKLLRADQGSGATTLMVNFIDLTLKRFLDADTATRLDYAANSFLYKPVTNAVGPLGLGGYDAAPLLDRTCLDIPLVGSVCLHGYLYDIDNEAGQKFFSYSVAAGSLPVFTIRPQLNNDSESGWMDINGNCIAGATSPCGLNKGNLGATVDNARDDDDGLQIGLTLNDVQLDLFFEPPTDATLTDVTDSTRVSPETDLSTYLKAYGKATLGTVQLVINLRVASNFNDSVNPHSISIGFELQDVTFDSNFQFVFQKGPYCNNNLKTTESQLGTVGYSNPALRPFRSFAPFTAYYAGLVSDAPAAGTSYYARVTGTYPHAAGSANGGSGTGRDRIGVNSLPYGYDDALDIHSDNPNNCKRPADACTVSGANFQHGGPEWNGISAACEYSAGGNLSGNADDATYKISEQITAIIPYIQGEIKVVAEDKFKNRTRGTPGYYLGPTSLLDLGATLADMSFDWPLRPGTDYVFLDALLQSDIDGDGTNEFWADQWGVLMPFNFALGVSWNSVNGITAPTASRVDRQACVQKLGSVTGFRDGIGEFNAYPSVVERTDLGAGEDVSDDPFLTRTIAPKGIQGATVVGAGYSAPFLGILTGFGFPVPVTPYGTYKFNVAPAAATVPAGPLPAGEAYGIGFSIHQNVLSAALYDATVKGLLCADIDATGQYARVTDQIGGTTVADLLNTSTFQLFFPKLYEDYPDRPMRIRMIPLLKRYTHNSACATNDDCETGFDNGFAANFAVTNAINVKPSLQADAEAPYVIMGGPPISLGLVSSPSLRYIWPDLSIVIPNLLLEFYVYGDASGSNNWYRVFAIDMGVVVGINIDVVKTPATYATMATIASAEQATWFPVGCIPPAPYAAGPAIDSGLPGACSGGYAHTKRVLRLAGLADPEINAIIEYSELTFGQANGTNAGLGTICSRDPAQHPTDSGLPTEPDDPACAGSGKSTKIVDNAFTNYQVLQGAMSNLIGIALSVDINALVEIGFDLGAFLNLPLVLDVPYIGPSYVASGAAAPFTNYTDREQPVSNGFGDYLVGGVSFDLSALKSSYLIQQIDYLLDSTSSTKPFGFDIDIGLAPHPEDHSGIAPDMISVPQTTVQAPLKVGADETVFKFSGFDKNDGTNGLRYTWRVDNGVWTVFSPAKEAHIRGLFEGKHTFEVKAINSKDMMQDVPARYTFVVDSIAPKLRVVGDRTVGSRASFFVEATDWLTPKEDIRVAYQLDGGRWSNFGYNKKISLSGLSEGRHTLRVKAADNASNAAESAFNFSASDGGFGCATVPGTGSMADVLIMLVLPALVLLRRRTR